MLQNSWFANAVVERETRQKIFVWLRNLSQSSKEATASKLSTVLNFYSAGRFLHRLQCLLSLYFYSYEVNTTERFSNFTHTDFIGPQSCLRQTMNKVFWATVKFKHLSKPESNYSIHSRSLFFFPRITKQYTRCQTHCQSFTQCVATLTLMSCIFQRPHNVKC